MMSYSIGEVAQKMNLTTSTLRYYEKEGLLPNIERKESGIRNFSDVDLHWLEIIECLKNTGMPLKDIRTFTSWCVQGDASLKQRYEMFLERKRMVEEQIANLQKTLETIDYKCWYYRTALEAGTENIHLHAKTEGQAPEQELSYY